MERYESELEQMRLYMIQAEKKIADANLQKRELARQVALLSRQVNELESK